MRRQIPLVFALALCFVFTLAAAFAPVATAQTPESAEAKNVSAQIEALLAAAYPSHEPGAAVIAMRGDEVVFRGASGMADLEMDVALEPDMVFRLGSITKQFTAAAIMLLEKDGKLSVSDPIEKFLPDYPVGDHTITIEHLLTHTSGIASYTSIPGYMAGSVRNDLSTDELVDVFDDQPMDFPPGTAYNYSNSGYVLLGAIIEEVTGISYADFVRERIFAPLRMERSDYGGHQIIPGRAEGYAWDAAASNWVNAPYLSMTQPHAAGSLLSTVDDLARWDKALFSGELLPKETLERMTSGYTLSDGEESNYGYGLVDDTLRGARIVQHGGGIFGFVTFGLHLPSIDGYVAVLSNAAGHPSRRPSVLARRIGAVLLDKPFPTFEPVSVPAEQLKTYEGVYQINDTDQRTVRVEDGKLFTQRTGGGRSEAVPAGDGRFFYPEGLSWFTIDLDGEDMVMNMHQDGAQEPEQAVRTSTEVPKQEEVEVAVEVLERYPGQYQLQPGFIITITLEDGQLMGQPSGQPKIPIFPKSETRFFLKVVDAEIEFHPAEQGSAAALTLFQGGREMRAERVE